MSVVSTAASLNLPMLATVFEYRCSTSIHTVQRWQTCCKVDHRSMLEIKHGQTPCCMFLSVTARFYLKKRVNSYEHTRLTYGLYIITRRLNYNYIC